MDIKNLYWMAGFLEGEGSFSSHRGVGRVSAPQKDIESLEKLKTLVSHGTLSQTKKGIHIWSLSGTHAIGLCMTLFLLMSNYRKEQIKKVLMAWKKGKVFNTYKIMCNRGHPLSGDNLTIIHRGNHQYRSCKICQRAAADAWVKRNPELAKEVHRNATRKYRTKLTRSENQMEMGR